MPLFGRPNVEKLQAKRSVSGLIKALGYRKDDRVRVAVAGALGTIQDFGEDAGRWQQWWSTHKVT